MTIFYSDNVKAKKENPFPRAPDHLTETEEENYEVIPEKVEDKNAAYVPFPRHISGLLTGYHGPNFSFTLWDGSIWKWDPAAPAVFNISLRTEAGLLALASGDELQMAEAYMNDLIDIQGDIVEVFALGDFLLSRKHLPARSFLRLRLLKHKALSKIRKKQTLKSDRQAIAFHYDISNDFYSEWLDSRMVYSCAYFSDRDEDLEKAQFEKLDYICRKLRLKPGDRFLDVGCGWGGLIIHAAREYGVHAIGITLSKAQVELAKSRVVESGLQKTCEVWRCDYRELAPDSFDKIASVGMFEHVGAKQLELYFKTLWRQLKPGGSLLNHGIADVEPPGGRIKPKSRFINKYVFPNGELVPIWHTIKTATRCGFEMCDVESLREHYYLTLKHWVDRLQQRHEQLKTICGEEKYRIWRLYMAASAYRFHSGQMNLYQTLLHKPGGLAVPLTRSDWYR